MESQIFENNKATGRVGVSMSSADEATNQDQADMARLGKDQQFKASSSCSTLQTIFILFHGTISQRRNFRFLSTLGFTCTLMATWESILLTSTLGLSNGGLAGSVYIYIGSFIGFFTSVASMAEMASISPTSGGQYHWASEFGGRSYQKFLSYATAGWPTLGLACLVGQISPIFSFLGPDAATHIAEEIKDASKVVPWCMISTALINGSLGFIMLITYLFTMGDLHEVIKAESGFSFITAFLNATGSKAATTSLGSLLVVMEACAAISVLATVSRQTFAFARDNALPFSQFFARVHPKSKVPVNSILASTVITILLSLINIGSTEAFNAIASLTIASLFMSYLVCIGCFIYRRLQWKEIPPARFSLGACGLPVNIISFLYLSFAIVFTFFPNNNYPTAVSMNWSVLVFGFVVIFAGLQYLIHGRKIYDGPVAYVEKIE
ncbi:amino acid permease [Histoplasma capsulatum]|uniref:Amino acid permease n=1 Tax=Ajellomyces capsulatus TaxID=5037 RepID=A0A8A1MDZ4_AJECA|nr:amino acid permease [Histoplasma capsulatum]